MPLFSDKSIEGKQKKRKIWTKLILFIGAGSFAGTAMIPVIGGIVQSVTQPSNTGTAAHNQVEQSEQLEQREAGFLAVLEREPDNVNALQGLVDTRLQLGDLQGARDPLQQLVEIYPEEQILKDLLAQVDESLGRTGVSTPEADPAPEEDSVSP